MKNGDRIVAGKIMYIFLLAWKLWVVNVDNTIIRYNMQRSVPKRGIHLMENIQVRIKGRTSESLRSK